MSYMKPAIYFLFFSFILLNIIGCSSKKNTKSGGEYIIHTNKGGKKVTDSSFVSFNLQYGAKDSILYTSYDKNRPMQSRFFKDRFMFNNVLNEGLLEMGIGDSATFWVPADSVYADMSSREAKPPQPTYNPSNALLDQNEPKKNGLKWQDEPKKSGLKWQDDPKKGRPYTRMPAFIKPGDKIKYTVSIINVQTQEEFSNERKAKQEAMLAADKQKIDAYLAEHKDLNMSYSQSGIAYKIDKVGSGDSPTIGTIAKAIYKTSLLDGTVVNGGDNTPTDLPINTQMRGVREALLMLKEGGKGTFIIPSALAYRETSFQKIPPNSQLVYEVEIISIKKDENQPNPPSNARLGRMGAIQEQKLETAPNVLPKKATTIPNLNQNLQKSSNQIQLKGNSQPLKPAGQQPKQTN